MERTFDGKVGLPVEVLDIFEIRLAILYQVQVVMPDATPSISTASGQPSPLANAEDGTVIGALEEAVRVNPAVRSVRSRV